MDINWDSTTEERTIAMKIAKRDRDLCKSIGINPRSLLDIQMDILATHLNGCPLRLQELYAADDFNFSHDVGGIARYLDRTTGQLTQLFRPRFAQPRKSVEVVRG